jgi:hypothetical protein
MGHDKNKKHLLTEVLFSALGIRKSRTGTGKFQGQDEKMKKSLLHRNITTPARKDRINHRFGRYRSMVWPRR